MRPMFYRKITELNFVNPSKFKATNSSKAKVDEG